MEKITQNGRKPLFDLGRQGEAWIPDRRSDKTYRWRFDSQDLEIRKFFDYWVVSELNGTCN